MRFYFEEEDRIEMRIFFEESLEPLCGERLEVYDVLLTKCAETNYTQIGKLTDDFKKQYEEVLKKSILRQFEEWQEGEASIQAFMRTMGAGDEDDEIMILAREFEEQLREIVERVVARELETRTSGTVPGVALEEVMEEIIDSFEKEIKSVKEIKGNVRRKEREKEDENDIYGNLCALLEGILDEYKSFFETYLKKGIVDRFQGILKKQSKTAFRNVDDEKSNNKIRKNKLIDTLMGEGEVFKNELF